MPHCTDNPHIVFVENDGGLEGRRYKPLRRFAPPPL